MVESAVHSGCSVIALDAFGDQDVRALTESYALRTDFAVPYSPNALFQASRQLDFDAVAYTSNFENHPEIIDLFAASHRILGNSPQTVRAVRDWRGLFSRLARAGFCAPETVLDCGAGIPRIPDQWLVKPVLSGGGHGIHFLRDRNLEPGRWMLQQYIPGKACSAAFVGNGRGAVLLGVAEQLIGKKEFGSRGFRYCGSILPLPEIVNCESGSNLLEQVRRAAIFLVREYGLVGVNGFDFIFDGRRIWLTEVNPRYSASMELAEKAYGLPIFQFHLESVVNGHLPDFDLESHLEDRGFFGKGILFCERECSMPAVLDFPVTEFRDIPACGEKLHRGSPICTFLVSRDSYDDANAELILKSKKLKEQIYGQTEAYPDHRAVHKAGDRNLEWKGTP
jgi:predicted ATP-grasp superfamily ATP-dependent carboligase